MDYDLLLLILKPLRLLQQMLPKMKAINEAIVVVPAFTNTMDQLIALTDKYWTELIPWNAKNQMSMLVKDALITS